MSSRERREIREHVAKVAAMEEQVASLEAKNAKLREELAKWERLTAGIDLPEYPVSRFVPKDHERENVKLRELVRDVVLLASCEGVSVTKMQLHANGGDWRTIADRMRELGIEVE